MSLAGKTLFITGASRGIGLAIALRAARDGANIAIAAKTADSHPKLQGTIYTAADEIERAGGKALPLVVDVRDEMMVKEALDKAAARFGGIDIVVNNAANALALPLGEITPEAWSKSFSVNLQGPVFLVQAALPYLRESQHAAILNVVSAGAFIFSPLVSMYSAAKAAMVSFTRSMAAEFASQGIRVNALAPGSVDTDMVRGNPPEFIDAMKASAFMQRIADPSEMIGPALLLVSDAGSFITGQTIVADGGMVAR